MAARIDLVGGDVNTAPATAALNPPWPINESGVKKIPVVPVPDRTYFFLPTLLFFQRDLMRLTVRPYFLRVVAGCCQNGVCCHTNY
jgi:hypothetical protein